MSTGKEDVEIARTAQEIAERERKKSWMLRAWISAGIFFMALPGTVLGFSNLLAISAHRGAASLPPAWMEGHGHAQVFGWIGSFILGIGFYSQPARGRSVLRIPTSCFVLWTAGVAVRWFANIYGWHWRLLVPLSAASELIAVFLFLAASSQHKLPGTEDGTREKPGMELWMKSVLLGTLGLTAAVVFNFVECIRVAVLAPSPSFPHALDQKYLVVLGWAFIVPMVWGFSARWLPSFLGLHKPRPRLFAAALMLDVAGVLAAAAGLTRTATTLFIAAAICVTIALRFFESTRTAAVTRGVHPSFPIFVRITYIWLMIAAAMGVWAAFADLHGGIWGASRHALTVGFAATMVFAIGPRILPHFGGILRIFSTGLMFASLLLLQAGCTLRVSSEPLAYEGLVPFAWKVLPISGILELSGVLVFALNLALTFAIGKSAFAGKHSSEQAAA